MIPKKYSGEQLVGRMCRTTRHIQNGGGAGVSPDSVCFIRSVVRGHGFTIQTETCDHCGQYSYISKVAREDLELIDELDPMEKAKYLLNRRMKAAQELLSACAMVDEFCGPLGVDINNQDACLGLDIRIWCEVDGAREATLEAIKAALERKKQEREKTVMSGAHKTENLTTGG